MRLVKVDILTIDKEKAQDILNMYSYKRQRVISKKSVAYYAKLMGLGEWLPGSEIDIAFAPNGDGTKHGYLVNGQHRLWACIASGKPIEFAVKEFDCDDANEVASLYGMIDTGRQRNVQDYVNAIGMDDEIGLGRWDLTKVSAAVGFIHAGFKRFSGYSITPGKRIELIQEYGPSANEFLGFVKRTETMKKLRRAAVMALGLITVKESSIVYGMEKIALFWIGLAMDDGLRHNDPRKIALKHILEVEMPTGRSGKQKVSQEYSARYLANCFNAWVENRSITYTRVIDPQGPIYIAGSQYKG